MTPYIPTSGGLGRLRFTQPYPYLGLLLSWAGRETISDTRSAKETIARKQEPNKKNGKLNHEQGEVQDLLTDVKIVD